jgi:hypothetical protein
MQMSHPAELTAEQAKLVGKLRTEYFSSESDMDRRREELRVNGEVVSERKQITRDAAIARAHEIVTQLADEPDHRIRKALRAEWMSLSYVVGSSA